MTNDVGPPSVALLGISQTEVCGIRDYAVGLAEELGQLGHDVQVSWSDLRRRRGPSHGWRTVVRQASATEVVVVNYSVFASAWHGIPLAVPLLAQSLSRLDARIVLLAHEMVYPWGRRGWRGAVQAITQRLALLPLVAASDVVVVTTEPRQDWLVSRRWLPSRPTFWAPVFSNLPIVPSVGAPRSLDVGVFGYGHETARRGLVLESVARVAATLPGTELIMLGNPGPASPAGRVWRQAARAVGCPLRFTGFLPADQLSTVLSGLGALLSFGDGGPTSRKTTLAAALANGMPTVALDGPDRWDELIDAGAVELVRPDATSLAKSLEALLTDSQKRQQLGRAGTRILRPSHVRWDGRPASRARDRGGDRTSN